MICPNCGTNLDDNATECFLCGCHIEEQTISDDGQNYSVNTCPVCGSEIGEQESVCPICGSPIEKITQTENNQEEYNTENIEKSEPQNRSNKNLIIIIISFYARNCQLSVVANTFFVPESDITAYICI